MRWWYAWSSYELSISLTSQRPCISGGNICCLYYLHLMLLIENGANHKTRAGGIKAALYRDGPGHFPCSTGSVTAQTSLNVLELLDHCCE